MTCVKRGERLQRSGLQDNAKRMHREPTPAEARFWHYAKNRGIGGMNFRRQVPVESYIADFLCAEERFIVEIDGGQHGEDRDGERDARLKALGFEVMRFWNSDVLKDMGAVVDTILKRLDSRGAPPHPALSPTCVGERNDQGGDL
jgi:very-short-patch-repair endonuclease